MTRKAEMRSRGALRGCPAEFLGGSRLNGRQNESRVDGGARGGVRITSASFDAFDDFAAYLHARTPTHEAAHNGYAVMVIAPRHDEARSARPSVPYAPLAGRHRAFLGYLSVPRLFQQVDSLKADQEVVSRGAGQPFVAAGLTDVNGGAKSVQRAE